jgi:hypothetical protein
MQVAISSVSILARIGAYFRVTGMVPDGLFFALISGLSDHFRPGSGP